MRWLLAVLFALTVPTTLSAQSYTISTFAGGALPVNVSGTSANLAGPSIGGITVDSAGNAFFPYQNVVLRLDAHTGLLSLFAGNGTAGYSGDNGPATGAQLTRPSGLAEDSAGNVFIADTGNYCVRKVVNGVISTVAGNGQSGYSGDGGPAVSAQLYAPYGVALDAAGDLFVSDNLNHVIRKVAGGVITTVAGNGQRGYSGDAGPATSAQLNYPEGIAVDSSGNLYIADFNNLRIREVSGGVITTVVGNGQCANGNNGPVAGATLCNPYGVAVDPAGNLYIADTGNNMIRKVSGGVITAVAGNGSATFGGDNGPALSAGLTPYAVALGSSGNIYISDSDNNRIRQVTSGTIATIAGGGPALGEPDGGPSAGAQFSSPSGAAVDSAGNVYIADAASNRVWKVANGVITSFAGNGTQGYGGDGGPATSAQLNAPYGLATDSAGNLYIADYGNCVIRRVAGGVITTVAGSGSCGYSGDNGSATSARISLIPSVAVDPAGNIYVADLNNCRIREVSSGIITTVAGNGSCNYSGDNGPATSAQLLDPWGVAVDSAGVLYISDGLNNRVRKVVNGVITTVAGNGTNGYAGDSGAAASAELSNPEGIAVDSAGVLYIADGGNNRVRKVANGVISTIAGGGPQFGDNGPALNAELGLPLAIAVSSGGNLFVVDSENFRIRLLSSLAASLSVSKSHVGDFVPGQSGASYTVIVSNVFSAGTTSGTVTVADTLPTGLTLVSMSGTGWSCSGNSCTRNDLLEPGSSYPAITVAVNVASNAPSQVTNQVTVSGGGSGAANASDVTTIAVGQPPSAVTVFSPSQGATGVAVNAGLTWTAPAGASTYNLYFGTSSPPPLLAPSLTTATYSPTMTAGTTYYWSVTAVNPFGSTPSAVWSFTTAAGPPGYRFVPVTPCRVLDTRNATGTFGGPIMAAGSTRTVPVPQSACNIPSTAQAYSLNITVVPPGPLAYLTAWPAGQAQPLVSTLNSYDGRIVANAAIVPAGASQAIEFYASDATHVIADINGYFAPLSTANSMSFYAAAPCRVADTRNSSGPFGGPYLSAGTTRSFVIPLSACAIPATAQAYSLNVTVVPHGGLGYLTMWPTGQTQPYVSTLNSPDGSVVANAAIVPAGTSNGAVSVFVTDATDVIVDINGYFAPPGSANALSLYTLTPCRVADTRQPTGAFGGPSLGAGGTRSFAVASSTCGVPAAPAYSLNVTVVPPAPLAYLTAWPTGQTQPYVSTLNSYAGKVVANAAIVPAGANGGVSVFVSDATNVILDINAYFAQ